MKYYAGIGSRNTPIDVMNAMTKTAKWLEKFNYVLRSGGAKGADTAFEQGITNPNMKQIFYQNDATEEARKIAKRYHPAWDRMSNFAKNLHGRNAFQILGRDLETPVDFVICWTPDGAETHKDRQYETGGTGTAISIANANGIRVYNFANENSINELRELFKDIKK